MDARYDVVVLGAGPAGLAAGIYAARARRSVLVLDSGTVGGQTILSYQVANYPGVAVTSGRELSRTMAEQARAFGCEMRAHVRIAAVELDGEWKVVTLKDGTRLTARTAILATGGVPRRLGVDGEERLAGRGISYCATCDGDFFTGRPIAVVGGGNAALEEAVSLTRYAERVTVIHELDHFQAEPWIVEEARASDKIDFLLNQRVVAFSGEAGLDGVRSLDKATGATTDTPVDGCFVFIGYLPNSGAFEGQVKVTEHGEIATDNDLQTSLPGVFAAGDVRRKRVRQITTAVADGTVAALSALRHLEVAAR